jgi:hypothetical protein
MSHVHHLHALQRCGLAVVRHAMAWRGAFGASRSSHPAGAVRVASAGIGAANRPSKRAVRAI